MRNSDVRRGAASGAEVDDYAPAAKRLLIAFIAGFIAVPVFHQSLLALFAAIGAVSAAPFSSEPAAVTGLPQVVSRALLGGVYGIALVILLERIVRHRSGPAFWTTAVGIGALLPSVVAWFIIEPIKGQPLASGGDPTQIGVALATNAAWGGGTAAIYSFVRRLRLV